MLLIDIFHTIFSNKYILGLLNYKKIFHHSTLYSKLDVLGNIILLASHNY